MVERHFLGIHNLELLVGEFSTHYIVFLTLLSSFLAVLTFSSISKEQ